MKNKKIVTLVLLIIKLITGCSLIEPTPIPREFKVVDLLLTNEEVPDRIEYPATKPEDAKGYDYSAYQSALMSWGTVPGIRYSVHRYQRVQYAKNTYEDLIVQPVGDLKDWTTVSLHADEYNFRCDSTINGHVCTLKARYEEFFIQIIFIAKPMVLKTDVDIVVRNMDARMMKYLHK